jgi:hypothetical protein
MGHGSHFYKRCATSKYLFGQRHSIKYAAFIFYVLNEQTWSTSRRLIHSDGDYNDVGADATSENSESLCVSVLSSR